MTEAPVIAAFDVATRTGVCFGRVGCKRPTLATWDMRSAGPGRPARLDWFFTQLHHFFLDQGRDQPVDQIWYEAPLNIGVMNKIGANDETVSLLRGAIGVLEVAAVRAGIEHIHPFSVQAARQHLTGQRTFSKTGGKSDAKKRVMQTARMLGIEVADDNQADAFAGWSYACGLANPRLAHLVTPLFARG
jgi:hypothetical protein